jgi:hypothetical protein
LRSRIETARSARIVYFLASMDKELNDAYLFAA